MHGLRLHGGNGRISDGRGDSVRMEGDSVKMFIIWAVLLVLQNASHTLASRAKNSTSLGYNAFASTFSNGVWFGSQFFIVHTLVGIADKSWLYITGVSVFYIFFTVIGSLVSHWLAMNYLEKGILKCVS